MTAVTVGTTSDYTSVAPDNYAGINNQEPSSPLLSSSNLWLVDPTQAIGQTTDTQFPEFSVTNLSETIDQNLVVPFENINSKEPEITFSTLSAISDERIPSTINTNDTLQLAAKTGTIQLATATAPENFDISGNTQLSGTTLEQSFRSTSAGTSTGGGGTGQLQSVADGGSTASVDGTDAVQEAAPEETLNSETPVEENVTTVSGDGELQVDPTSQVKSTSNVDPTSPVDPTDVPFSFTESVGLGLLVCIFGLHKMWRHRVRSLKSA